MSIAHHGGQNCGGVHERRSGNNSVVIVGIALCFHQSHAAAVGAAVEVSALDGLRSEKIKDELFCRNSHFVGGAVVVVEKLWRVRHSGGNQGPTGIGGRSDVSGVRDGGSVAIVK